MEPQIEEIYLGRVNFRGRDPRYARILQSIVRVSGRYKISLRQDALYFLANNIADMVVGPMLGATERGIRLESGRIVSEEELFSYIEGDLPLIIESALSAANERERQQISATSVIIGLGRVIDRLQINNTKLWGP
jgi:hypothetical protein